MQARILYRSYINAVYGLEQTVSLRQMSGYEGLIEASPGSRNSTVGILLEQGDKNQRLVDIETSPSMEKRQGGYAHRTHGLITQFTFSKRITAGSIDDLSVRFKIAEPERTDWATLAGVGAAVSMLTVAGFLVWRKRGKSARRAEEARTMAL